MQVQFVALRFRACGLSEMISHVAIPNRQQGASKDDETLSLELPCLDCKLVNEARRTAEANDFGFIHAASFNALTLFSEGSQGLGSVQPSISERNSFSSALPLSPVTARNS